LARQIVQRKPPTEISQEEAGQQLLAEHSKLFHQTLAVGRLSMPVIEREKMTAETLELQRLFRNRARVGPSGRYRIEASHGLERRTVHQASIKPKHFRFDSDEMEVNEIKLVGVRFMRAEEVPASQNNPPGRKAGQNSPKGLAREIVLSILNDKARRPPKHHGRKIELARMVGAALTNEDKPYAVNSIEKYIRGTVKEWEDDNPDE
jgi:hypothetical protein